MKLFKKPVKTFTSLGFLIFFVLFLLITSCSKEDIFISTDQGVNNIDYNQPFVEGTRLAFSSKERVQEYLDNWRNEPEEQFDQVILDYEGKGFSSSRIINPEIQQDKFKRKYLTGVQSRNNDHDIDLDEDELIFDEYFASILNEDYEIVVEGLIYKYTDKGAFYTETSNYDALLLAYTSYQLRGDLGETYLGNNVNRWVPDPDKGDVAGLEMPPYILQPPGGGGGGLPPNGGGGETGDCAGCDFDLSDEVAQLNLCNSGGFVGQMFGPGYSCKVKFDHDQNKRIKTKFSAQNFLIARSINLKVKIQKHRTFLGIGYWDKSNISADKLELGAAVLEFEYDWAIAPSDQIVVSHYIPGRMVVQYGGHTIARNWYTGQVESFGYQTPRELFDGFPFAYDEDIIRVYLPKPLYETLDDLGVLPDNHDLYDIIFSYSTQDVNDALQELSKDAVIMLLEYLQEEINGDVVVFVEPDISDAKFRFSLISYKKSDCEENKIEKLWDFETAEVGFKTNFQGGTSAIFDPPNNYNHLRFVGHGIGKEDGCHYAGSRLVLEDN